MVEKSLCNLFRDVLEWYSPCVGHKTKTFYKKENRNVKKMKN